MVNQHGQNSCTIIKVRFGNVLFYMYTICAYVHTLYNMWIVCTKCRLCTSHFACVCSLGNTSASHIHIRTCNCHTHIQLHSIDFAIWYTRVCILHNVYVAHLAYLPIQYVLISDWGNWRSWKRYISISRRKMDKLFDGILKYAFSFFVAPAAAPW